MAVQVLRQSRTRRQRLARAESDVSDPAGLAQTLPELVEQTESCDREDGAPPLVSLSSSFDLAFCKARDAGVYRKNVPKGRTKTRFVRDDPWFGSDSVGRGR